jgi:hypothetical protein
MQSTLHFVLLIFAGRLGQPTPRDRCKLTRPLERPNTGCSTLLRVDRKDKHPLPWSATPLPGSPVRLHASVVVGAPCHRTCNGFAGCAGFWHTCGMTENARGGCLSGAVRIEASLPPQWCAHRHCTLCRRAHMAGSVAWVGFERTAIVISREEHLQRHDSTADASRHSCRRCGATLLFEGKRWPGEWHVELAAFPEGVGLAPQAHACFDQRASWVHVENGLPRLGGESGTEHVQ